VHRIPLPLPQDALRAVNVYLIEDGDDLVLVDGGWSLPESMAEFERATVAAGLDPGRLRQILVTHTHRDHYTQAIALRRRYGAQVLVGEGERPALEAIRAQAAAPPTGTAPATLLAQLRAAGAALLADGLVTSRWRGQVAEDWQLPDGWIAAGELKLSTRTLTAIPTPGHTRGHLVFLDPDAGVMFTGDHVLPHITPSIGFELRPSALPLGEFLDSLRLVTRYPDARLLPAHGPVTGSVHARVAQLLAHHERRLDAARRALRDGATDAYQAAQSLTWTRRDTPLAELNPFNQVLAVLETGAHLELLVHRGDLSSSTVDGVVRYAPTGPAPG